MPEVDLQRLAEDGLVRLEGSRVRTTARWQAAVARAALRLQEARAPWDLRLPIASALIELYDDLGDEEIARLTEAMLPVERAEVGPIFDGPEAPT